MLVYLPVVFIIFIIIGSYLLYGNSDSSLGAISAFIGLMGLLFSIFPLVGNYNSAASYQAIINKQEPIIKHYQDFINRLNVKIDAAGDRGQTIFTSNNDTPVKSMVEAQLKAESDMLNAAKARDEAGIKLEAIRLGLYGKVVDWITEPKENK
jgi:ABC-type multidrug transport system fused ATPase/permease subunit